MSQAPQHSAYNTPEKHIAGAYRTPERHRGAHLSVSIPAESPPASPEDSSCCGGSSSSTSGARGTIVTGARPPCSAVRFARAAGFLLLGCATSAATVLTANWPSVMLRMSLIETYRLGPLYLALVLTHLAYHTAGLQLGIVHRPIQIQMPDKKVYRILDGGPGISGALILTQDRGAFGNFARARQAAAALEESMPLFLAHVVAGGFVLPWTAMILSGIFGLARAGSAAQCAISGRGYNLTAWLSGAAEGAAAGVCLFVGILATAREISEL